MADTSPGTPGGLAERASGLRGRTVTTAREARPSHRHDGLLPGLLLPMPLTSADDDPITSTKGSRTVGPSSWDRSCA